MRFFRIAARVAVRISAQPIPSRDQVEKALEKAWNAILRPFELWNIGEATMGTEPQISDERRTRHIDVGMGWEFVMKAEHGGYGDDDPGDFITVKFMNPVTKSTDLIYEGPERTLGLPADEFDAMVDAVFDTIAETAVVGDVPN